MPALRELLAELGHPDARTFIQSGNVVFPRARPDLDALEAAIADRFGVRTTIVLRTAAQLRRLASSRPFGEATPRCSVVFLAGRPSPARVRALAALDLRGDRFARVGPDLAVLYGAAGFHRARLTTARIETVLGVEGTLRNWRTVTALAELSSAG